MLRSLHVSYSVEENEIISRTHRSAMVSLKKRLADAKAESAKATKEYESLKLEIIKAVQGESAFPMDILSELVNNARTRMLDANAQLTELNKEVEKSNQRIEAIKADYRRIRIHHQESGCVLRLPPAHRVQHELRTVRTWLGNGS